jgi:protein-tyrosine-phosphatase
MTRQATVLFVCVHNAGRSQMAAALLNHYGMGRIDVRSAGSAPGEQINPAAVLVMEEWGMDLFDAQPKLLDPRVVEHSDVVVTMGCGDTCPIFPGVKYEDWVLDDPAGQPVERVREIRDEIDRRVRKLMSEVLD